MSKTPQPTNIEPVEDNLAARVPVYPKLSGRRLMREFRELRYAG